MSLPPHPWVAEDCSEFPSSAQQPHVPALLSKPGEMILLQILETRVGRIYPKKDHCMR